MGKEKINNTATELRSQTEELNNAIRALSKQNIGPDNATHWVNVSKEEEKPDSNVMNVNIGSQEISKNEFENDMLSKLNRSAVEVESTDHSKESAELLKIAGNERIKAKGPNMERNGLVKTENDNEILLKSNISSKPVNDTKFQIQEKPRNFKNHMKIMKRKISMEVELM